MHVCFQGKVRDSLQKEQLKFLEKVTKFCSLRGCCCVFFFSPSINTVECAMSRHRLRAVSGHCRYMSINTSTGSSTSGVVDLDFSSGSNKSEPHAIFSLPPRKSVLIVETTCSPDTEPSSPEDPARDPLLRHRTSSFKRAIERGPSADSNQSAETCEPASTSPEDLTPDRPDLPPYPHPPPPPIAHDPLATGGDHAHSYGAHLTIVNCDPSITHFAHASAEATKQQPVLDALSASHCDNSCFVDKSAVKDVYFVEDLHSRFKGPFIEKQTSLDAGDANSATEEGSNTDVK